MVRNSVANTSPASKTSERMLALMDIILTAPGMTIYSQKVDDTDSLSCSGRVEVRLCYLHLTRETESDFPRYAVLWFPHIW